jgi:hypothetical protein
MQRRPWLPPAARTKGSSIDHPNENTLPYEERRGGERERERVRTMRLEIRVDRTIWASREAMRVGWPLLMSHTWQGEGRSCIRRLRTKTTRAFDKLGAFAKKFDSV